MKFILRFMVVFTCFCSACNPQKNIEVSQILGQWELKGLEGRQLDATNTQSNTTTFYCKDFDNCFMTITADSIKCKGSYNQVLTKDGTSPQIYTNLSFSSQRKYTLSGDEITSYNKDNNIIYKIDSFTNSKMTLTWYDNENIQGLTKEASTSFFFQKR